MGPHNAPRGLWEGVPLGQLLEAGQSRGGEADRTARLGLGVGPEVGVQYPWGPPLAQGRRLQELPLGGGWGLAGGAMTGAWGGTWRKWARGRRGDCYGAGVAR